MVTLPSGTYELTTSDFPTVDRRNPYELSEGERELMEEMREIIEALVKEKKYLPIIERKPRRHNILPNSTMCLLRPERCVW